MTTSDTSKPLYLPGDPIAKTAAMIRVNHAGEYGAKRIYQGQIDALRENNANAKDIDDITHMAEQEEEHLEYFTNYIGDHHIRPTVLYPLWHYGAYAMGYICGKFGVKYAMNCTAAVEDVIDQHYQEQIDRLDNDDKENDKEIIQKIKKFQADEQEHHHIGNDHINIEDNPIDKSLYKIINTITKTAIYISYRI